MESAPLHGIRVVDCSRVLAGPYCAELLAQLGADVIKVEHPGGDELRTWPPMVGAMGASFLALNARKRSIAVDLKAEAGAELVRDLAADADVLIENFTTGTMTRLGLDERDLRARNPRLVYVSITAFGRTGPRAEEPGYEALMQAYSGVMAVTGPPGGDPVRCGVSFLDMGTGTSAALGVMSALFRRATTGEGATVEASLLATSVGLAATQFSNYLQHGAQPPRAGSAHPQVVPYQAYSAADGDLMIASGNQRLFVALCDVLDRRELIDDPRFVDNRSRVDHREECVGEIAAAVADREVVPLLAELRRAGVPASSVNDYEAVMADGQIDAVGLLDSGHDPDYGAFSVPGIPFVLDGVDRGETATAPRLGEHSTEVMRDVLAYDPERIERLLASGVVSGE